MSSGLLSAARPIPTNADDNTITPNNINNRDLVILYSPPELYVLKTVRPIFIYDRVNVGNIKNLIGEIASFPDLTIRLAIPRPPWLEIAI